jgi:hypothetical protein
MLRFLRRPVPSVTTGNRLMVTMAEDGVSAVLAARHFRSPLRLDEIALREAAHHSPAAYGHVLFTSLFSGESDPGFASIADAYDLARAAATPEAPVALWLRLLTGAPDVAWEYLRDPRHPAQAPLAARQAMPFARWAAPTARAPVDMRPPVYARPLRILCAVVSPDDLGAYSHRTLRTLAPLEVTREQVLIAAGLAPLQALGLVEFDLIGGPDATWPRLRAALERDYHVLQLLAHGVTIGGEGYLVLADDKNRAVFKNADVFDDDLLRRLALIVLAACDSAGPAAGVAPQLARRGAAAVIAMQGRVAAAVVRLFNSRFYADLLRTGRVDAALSGTRHELFRRAPAGWSWGVPALFLGSATPQLLQPDPELLTWLGARWPLWAAAPAGDIRTA